ncbi:MAG: histidine triad nucleotide-binding protein [Deltaproteobacteria bacterium]|nr:histidine triad nucleotide-binding protein [Deltaproteobacteria bacterium]MBN2673674.1 histidine triad nucleotide-binding protein [Deltaproteobacteria bacterium]
MIDDCIFCKIVDGQIPCTKLYEDDNLLAFEDIHPIAPTHFLVIPKEHIPTLDDVEERHAQLLGDMLYVSAQLAQQKGLGASGYRQVINCRESAGQVVFHLHMHVIGGRKMDKMG